MDATSSDRQRDMRRITEAFTKTVVSAHLLSRPLDQDPTDLAAIAARFLPPSLRYLASLRPRLLRFSSTRRWGPSLCLQDLTHVSLKLDGTFATPSPGPRSWRETSGKPKASPVPVACRWPVVGHTFRTSRA